MTSRSNSDWVGSLSHSGGTCTDKWEKQLLGWGHVFSRCFYICDMYPYVPCLSPVYHLRWEFVVLDFKAAVELERRRCLDSGMLSDQLGIGSHIILSNPFLFLCG